VNSSDGAVEAILLNTPYALVTATRIVIDEKVYAIANITSVSAFVVPPGRLRTVASIAIGALSLWFGWQMNSALGMVIGFACIVIAIGIAREARSTYVARIFTAAGETGAYKSYSQEDVAAVVSAINSAISARG
jgi:hypothetical protein